MNDRYLITQAEAEKIIKATFESLDPPVLRVFPPKEKKKLVVLRVIARQFEPDRKYGEREVNEILKPIYGDYATLRRSLIDYGFMARTLSGTEYWLK